MLRAIELAKKSAGYNLPNPYVGCVIVYRNMIIGEGYHQQFGQAHAEVNAIKSVMNKSLLTEATLYVTLEPCSHFGKTPPCADLILTHKIPTVVVGSVDPNTQVAGKGIQLLKDHGVTVITGVEEEACKQLNPQFFSYHINKRPYITLKWAQTLDGFIGPVYSGNPIVHQKENKITPPIFLLHSHQLRASHQAILVGTNTIIHDNASLTNRHAVGAHPLRIIPDFNHSIPLDANIFLNDAPTLMLSEKIRPEWENFPHVEVVLTNKTEMLPTLIQTLFTKGITGLLVEGGTTMHQLFINENLWDEAIMYTANHELKQGTPSPVLTNGILTKEKNINQTLISYFRRL